MKKILLLYKSQTGFTKRYAEWIAAETGAVLMDLKKARPEQLSGYDTIVFGSRLHAETIDGYRTARRLFKQASLTASGSSVVLFAVGAMPGADMPEADKAAIQKIWKTNLTPEEQHTIPCFYLPGGLCYEKMSLPDRWMMKFAASFLKRSQGTILLSSYDISSRDYIRPLVEYLKRSDPPSLPAHNESDPPGSAKSLPL